MSASHSAVLRELPDECKQLIWRFLDFQALCRVSCVCQSIADGARVGEVWFWRLRRLVQLETKRLASLRLAPECALKRQGASRHLQGINNTEDQAQTQPSAIIHSDSDSLVGDGDADLVRYAASIADDATRWKHCYRDYYVSLKHFEHAQYSFVSANDQVQELKRQRNELKESLQHCKSRSQSLKSLRKSQMHCIRFMNRTHRRLNASQHAQSSQVIAKSRSELTCELQQLEADIANQSSQLFALRTKSQKCHLHLRRQFANTTQLLQQFEQAASAS